ncbi:hypothetical protein F5883DRAFT_550549 [Diaporthe sp. PMI_573]|nr:hypothetical protein F5883DRAFT_550549 [Diaporthaceae sp. PMI_573]
MCAGLQSSTSSSAPVCMLHRHKKGSGPHDPHSCMLLPITGIEPVTSSSPCLGLLVMRSTDELNGLGGISFVVFILLCGTVLDSVCWPCGGEPTFGARECSLSVQHCTNNQPSSCVLPLWSITWTGMKTGMCMAVGCWLLAAGK